MYTTKKYWLRFPEEISKNIKDSLKIANLNNKNKQRNTEQNVLSCLFADAKNVYRLEKCLKTLKIYLFFVYFKSEAIKNI